MLGIIAAIIVYGTLLLGFAGALAVLLGVREHFGGRDLGPTSQKIYPMEYPERPERKEVEFIQPDMRMRRCKGSNHDRQTRRLT